MLDTVTETTDQVELREKQAVLSGELGHRLKNLLSVVQAVASQTLRQSSDLEAANDALSFRLAAFGRATDVLTASHWEDADLHTLADVALATHDTIRDRFVMHGPSIKLASQPALALSLALHELATNATKYGALSNDTGIVHINWTVLRGTNDGGSRLKLTWHENGGPPVSSPARRGFGSLMIERSLKSYFRGNVLVDYRPDGLFFELDAPLAGVAVEP